MGAVNGLPWVPLSTEPVEPADELVALDPDVGGPAVWPYVAAGRSFQRPTSSINLAFKAHPNRVRAVFVRGFDDVNVTRGGEPEHPPGADWSVLDSAPRYVYVAPSMARIDEGEWREPAYQLHLGAYFGTQSHLRVYDATAESEPWTVVQAHTEHWDWFAMNHRVDSLERPRGEIEAVLFEDPAVSDVRRVYFDNGDTFDADGWTTIVHLAGLLALAGVSVLPRSARDRRRLALLLAVTALPLLVRFVGVAAGEAGLPHDPVSRVIYPFLAVGMPAIAVLGGRRLPPWEGFALAAAGFAAAVVLDFTYLQVDVVQLGLVAHRALAAVALGLLAAGHVDEGLRESPRLVAGVVLWLVVLVSPHVAF